MINVAKSNLMPTIGAIIGVAIGVITKSGMYGTLILGALLSATGYYLQNKFS